MKRASYYIRIAGSLLLICMVTALLLAAVNLLTRDVIAENARREKEEAIALLYPSFVRMEELPVLGEAEGVHTVYAVYEESGMAGYVVDLETTGFGGPINMMVGISPEGVVSGVRVVSHSETPGFGSRAAEQAYLAAYTGKGGELVLGADIDAVSGATISSRAILAGVNLALSLGLGGEGV